MLNRRETSKNCLILIHPPLLVSFYISKIGIKGKVVLQKFDNLKEIQKYTCKWIFQMQDNCFMGQTVKNGVTECR